MMAATATARVKEGGCEVSNAKRLVRRAICFLFAVGTCLPASDTTARPTDPSGRGRTGVHSVAAPGQEGASIVDKPNKNNNKAKTQNGKKPVEGEKKKKKTDPPVRPKPSNPSNKNNPPASAPAAPGDSHIHRNIKLRIVISNEQSVAASGINVDLWSREREKNIPATKVEDATPSLRNGAYTINLSAGLDLKKDYWVVVASTDKQLSGEQVVPRPVSDNAELPIDVALYPAVNFHVSARREGTVRVDEKNQKAPSIPHALKPNGSTSFVKGLNPHAEYILVTNDGRSFHVDPNKIEGNVLRIDLFTIIKVSMEDKPIRGAKVFVIVDDPPLDWEITNEKGEAKFEADAERVQAVKVEAKGDENFFCDKANDANCLIPDESGALVVTLDKSSPGFFGLLLQWGAIIVFPLAAVVLIVLGVAIFRILLNPVTPLPEVPRVVTMPKSPSSATPFVGAGTSLQTAGTETQESSPAPVQHEATLISNADAAQPDGSSVAKAYSVPGSLSAEMAKEAYKRWVRREKLTRDPVKLDPVLSNITDEESQLLKETNDPGSKFILFTDGKNSGWLFPNPAPSVFQTEVEQTWRLIFKDLSKDEFGRKKERLNPVEARRADGAQGRGMWTAEPKPYEFD